MPTVAVAEIPPLRGTELKLCQDQTRATDYSLCVGWSS